MREQSRLYWPFRAVQNHPYSHQFWTHYELLQGSVDSLAASKRIRRVIRLEVFEKSSFQTIPPLISSLREQHHTSQLAKSKDTNERLSLAEGEISKLRQSLDDRDVIINGLNNDLDNQGIVLNREIKALKRISMISKRRTGSFL